VYLVNFAEINNYFIHKKVLWCLKSEKSQPEIVPSPKNKAQLVNYSEKL
jgi:hypothetical protein